MKKTAFDKIVVGFVVLVVIIFALLMVYSISTAQNSVLSERKSTMKNEITMLADGAMTDYSNGTIDSKELYKELQHAADTLDMGIWLTDERSNIIFRSGSSSGSSESGGSSKDSDSHSSTNDNLKNYVEPDELFASFCFENTFGGYFSEDTLVIGQPLYSWNNYMGTIILTSPMTFKQDIKSRMLSTTFVPFLILMLIAMIALMLMSNSLLKPIREIIKTSKSYAQGNFNARVNVTAKNEFGELARYMEEMADELSRSNEYRKSFISNISHDFRSPLTSIKGYIEGIMDGVADTEEKRNRYIRTIYNKVNDMNSLIEELFLYAKLDSNSVTYSFAKVNVDAYFQDCVEEISLDLESQGVDFGYFNYADRDTVIIADPEQLKRVVNNIIGNSVKYASPDRKLMISLRIMEEAEFVKIEIEDNGKGIARNEVPLIFDRCYRTDASRNSSKGGSGLGLSIAKKIIEEHGGKIWAVSTEGVGTTMCFVLRKYKENNVYE